MSWPGSHPTPARGRPWPAPEPNLFDPGPSRCGPGPGEPALGRGWPSRGPVTPDFGPGDPAEAPPRPEIQRVQHALQRDSAGVVRGRSAAARPASAPFPGFADSLQDVLRRGPCADRGDVERRGANALLAEDDTELVAIPAPDDHFMPPGLIQNGGELLSGLAEGVHFHSSYQQLNIQHFCDFPHLSVQGDQGPPVR